MITKDSSITELPWWDAEKKSKKHLPNQLYRGNYCVAWIGLDGIIKSIDIRRKYLNDYCFDTIEELMDVYKDVDFPIPCWTDNELEEIKRQIRIERRKEMVREYENAYMKLQQSKENDD